MSTAVFDTVRAVSARIGELELLVERAKAVERLDERYYNTLCRACTVLLASHLEGYIKEITRSFILDLNFHLSAFAKMPISMKRSFCRKIALYEGVPSAEIEERTTQLIAFFDQNTVPIDFSSFRYKENSNKNPSPSVIDGAFSKIGIESIVESLPKGVESIFSNDAGDIYKVRRDMRRFQSYLFRFPYRSIEPKYTFQRFKRPKGSSRPIWYAYIDGVLTRRHSVAHGDTMENETSWEELNQDIVKMEVLMQVIAYSAADLLAKA